MTTQGNTAESGQVLVLRGLHRNYGKVQAVGGIDLQVAAGETLALLGPNGAGKSTTLAMVLGLLAPSSGAVSVLGRTPHQAIADGLVGALLQSGAGSGLPPGTRIGELVRFVASLYRRPLSPPVVIEQAGLVGLAGRKVERLSGGELQRVRFALAICANPRLLILDEPTFGLDVSSAQAAMIAAMLVLNVLGGLVVPLKAFPQWMRDVAHVLPTYHLGDLGWNIVARRAFDPVDVLVLAAYGVAFAALAAWRYQADQARPFG